MWKKRIEILESSALLLLALTHPIDAEDGLAEDSEISPAFSVTCSVCSAGQARRILDHAATEALTRLDYEENAADRAERKLAGLSGIEDPRAFARWIPAGERTLELGYSRHPAAGYELVGYGLELPGGSRRANPDLREIEERIVDLVDQVSAQGTGREPWELATEIYKMSYIQSDRALALLKALGYSTIEYSAEDAETIYDRIYTPIQTGEWKLPIVVKLIDAAKTSLLEPFEGDDGRDSSKTMVPDIGGNFLHHVTTSEALQRLLIVHDPDDSEPLLALRTLLEDRLDVAARQVVIEALVMQLSHRSFRDLGLTFNLTDGRRTASFQQDEGGVQRPFSLIYDSLVPRGITEFRATLHALAGSGEAEVLSNPSVLVLDGRQARLQIGQQIPVITSTVSVGVVEESVEYFPVGIVLNLRPRISADGNEISMQVETVVSAVDPISSTAAGASNANVFVAPVVNSVQVETLVRVADNTPFIIGGMILEDRNYLESRVPGLSKIPLLGKLFRRRKTEGTKAEVLIVLTPHIVQTESADSDRGLPRSSATFEKLRKEFPWWNSTAPLEQ